MEKLDGLIAATHTPMRENGDLKLENISDYFHFLSRNNIRGIFLNGSTSEGYHLTTAERKQTVEAWSNAAEGSNFKIFVFVGHLSTRDACDLAEHAASLKNIHGISATAPFYQKPASLDLLIDTCSTIAASSASKPFYYYHIPVLTQVAVPMTQFLTQAADRIPNLKGVKYTHNDLEEYMMCKDLCGGKFEMFAGIDEIALASKACGATNYIGSTYNFMAPLYYKIFSAVDQGNLPEAQYLQKKAISIIKMIAPYGFISACKFIMKEIGIDNGYVRLPSKQISDMEKTELMKGLKMMGVDDLLSK